MLSSLVSRPLVKVEFRLGYKQCLKWNLTGLSQGDGPFSQVKPCDSACQGYDVAAFRMAP